jgi:o-succinylbenzoate---CoA ligase
MAGPASGFTPDWLRQRAATSPESLAMLCGADRLTFAALDRRVDAFAAGLEAAGVGSRDAVALLAGSSTGFVLAVHAVARLGAVLVPLNLRLSPAEMQWQLVDSDAAYLLSDAAHAAQASALAAQAPQTKHLLLETLAAADSGLAPVSEGERFALAATQTIVYTSGTTGRPKGAMLSYGNHLWSAIGSALNLGVQPEDRWLACMPLFHVGGLAILLRSVIYGIPAVVHETFDPARANRALEQDGVTTISVVANMLQRMLAERGDRPYPASLRCVLLGGGPAPEPLLRDCEARGVPVVQTYGLTEAASQVATLSPRDALRKLGSAGKPLFGTELRIVTPEGETCDARLPGEIVVRGPTVTAGYLNRPSETANVLRDGWLHTGDLGYLDDEGYLYVLDRRDDLIISGGENVYPAEIEAVLQSHPAVVEAGVAGLPDARWGQTPLATVVLEAGARVSAEELIEFCRGRLAGYKTPSRIEFAAQLPRNAAGKLVRSELRRQVGGG